MKAGHDECPAFLCPAVAPGTSETLKRGTMIKGIHLTDDPDEVECRHTKIKGLVLRTEFLKKA